MNDDDIIAKGLLAIRQGLVHKDLQQIADGYESISGEKINISTEIVKPQNNKSKLDKVRDKLHQEIEDLGLQRFDDEKRTNWQSLTNKDIYAALVQMGAEYDEIIKLKPKKKLVEFAKKFEESYYTVHLHRIQHAPGTVLHQKSMQIITTAEDPSENKKNLKRQVHKDKPNGPRTAPPEKVEGDGFSYDPSNSTRGRRRS